MNTLAELAVKFSTPTRVNFDYSEIGKPRLRELALAMWVDTEE